MNILILFAVFCSVSALRFAALPPTAMEAAQKLDKKIIDDIRFKKTIQFCQSFKGDTMTYKGCGKAPMRFTLVVSYAQNIAQHEATAIRSQVQSASLTLGGKLTYVTTVTNIPNVSRVKVTAERDSNAPAGFKVTYAEQLC